MPAPSAPVATVWRDPAWPAGAMRLTIVDVGRDGLRIDVPLTSDTLKALLASITRCGDGIIAEARSRAAFAVDGIAA